MMDMLMFYIYPNVLTLEPSAGDGLIADRLVNRYHCTVDAVEMNKEKANALLAKDICRIVFNDDFLMFAKYTHNRYRQIVAVPPYKDNVDCQHIMAMYELLEPNGRLISFTLPYWTNGIYYNQIAFRKWLQDKNVKINFLEDKSYVSCPKMLLIIEK